MKTKFTILSFVLAAFFAPSAFAAVLHVAPAAAGAGDCSTVGDPCTITTALSLADPGDTILLAAGTYTDGEIDIYQNAGLTALDFLTIRGPQFALEGNDAGRAANGGGGAEAIFTGAGDEYIFGIRAHNVTIEGIQINTTGTTDTWAGIRILEGGWDRWTIQNNAIHNIDDTKDAPASGVSNFSYGVYGDAQTTSGSLTMTGGLITGNYFHTLGNSSHLTGANKSSGVGIYLEGIEGEDADCNTIDRFTCGVWIYDNVFEHMFTGQNQSLQGITTPGGKEYSYGAFHPLPVE